MENTGILEEKEMSMEDILKNEESSLRNDIKAGEIISVKIVAITADAVMVDVGMKAEGVIPKDEFKKEYLEQLNAGDSIPVFLQALQSHHGNPIVSYRKAVEISAWKKIMNAYNDKIPLEGKISKRVKGGFLIDIGIEGFIPASQMDVRPVRKPDDWVGKAVQVVVTEVDHRKKNVIVSRRKIEEARIKQVKEKILSTLKVGDIIKGTVTSITKFGSFVDIGGIEGLLHVGNISWHRIDRIDNVMKVGETIKVKVLSIEQNGDKISLGKKQIEPHPWEGVEQRYTEGMTVRGKVSTVTHFGVFIEIDKGVEGLLHLSEVSWKDKNSDLKRRFSIGQEVSVLVLSVDRAAEKISLSLKRTQENPWEKAKIEYKPGSRITGKVTHITPFGAFVMMPLGIEGLVHVSDMSWMKRIRHPKEVVKEGQEVEAVVIEVLPKEEKISLGFKQLTVDPYEKYKSGKHVEGIVKKIFDFGAVVEIGPSIEAFIHISEMYPKKASPDGKSIRLDHPSEAMHKGEHIHAKVIKVNRTERKIDLSCKKYERDMEKHEMKKYMNKENTLTLGDLLGGEE